MPVTVQHDHHETGGGRQVFSGLAHRWLRSSGQSALRYVKPNHFSVARPSRWEPPTKRGRSGERAARAWLKSRNVRGADGASVAPVPRLTEHEFHSLAAQWKEETEFLSSTTQIILNPAYQRIIGMGPAAIPLILEELRSQPDHWFWALFAITGENVVPQNVSFDEAVQAWLNWGASQGYIEREIGGP
jgi:hypothetical protein